MIHSTPTYIYTSDSVRIHNPHPRERTNEPIDRHEMVPTLFIIITAIFFGLRILSSYASPTLFYGALFLVAVCCYCLVTLPPSVSCHRHARAKHPAYPERVSVPDGHVSWDTEWKAYAPVEFTHRFVMINDRTKNPTGWADPSFDHADFAYANTSYLPAIYDGTGKPRNPAGRTGMTDRGLLGKWGPNHAADPIVTRWDSAHRLQMVLIKRQDTGEWAIPGGMVDPNEKVSATLEREFGEEAGVLTKEQRDTLFSNGRFIYKGYVDDPRNTDNAWMETWVAHFHAHDKLGKMLVLEARDDAADVDWVSFDDERMQMLYASHREFVHTMLVSFAEEDHATYDREQWIRNVLLTF